MGFSHGLTFSSYRHDSCRPLVRNVMCYWCCSYICCFCVDLGFRIWRPLAYVVDVVLIILPVTWDYIENVLACVAWFDLWIIYMLWMSNAEGVCHWNLGVSFSFSGMFSPCMCHVSRWFRMCANANESSCLLFPSGSVYVIMQMIGNSDFLCCFSEFVLDFLI